MNFLQLLDDSMSAITESSLSRIQSKVISFDTGAITAFRGNETLGTNRSNNRKLKAYLMTKGYSVTPIKGTYIENQGSVDEREIKGEESFYVADQNNTGKLQRELERLGNLFDQDSILFSPMGGKDAFLIGTTDRDNTWIKKGERINVGSAKFGKTTKEFLSKIRNRQFAFESASLPTSTNDKWAMSLLAESVASKLKALETVD